MRAVIQRTNTTASVTVEDQLIGQIPKGLVVYLGVEDSDTTEDLEWLANKVIGLRIFNDEEHKMNLSVTDINGGILVISQFTLFASTKKGNRPSYLRSGKPEMANSLINSFISLLKRKSNLQVESGLFGAHMLVEYVNDGPVTIMMDTRNKE